MVPCRRARAPSTDRPFKITHSTNVRYRVFDKAGNSAVKAILVKIDTKAPTLSLGSPGVNAFVAGSVKISVKATDKQSRIARVNYYVDGRLIVTDTKHPFVYSFKTAGLSKGRHTLKAKAFDVAGNTRSKSITVKVT